MEDIKKIPVLRFPEFSGEWEIKKLGDIATFSKGKGISKADIVEEGDLECIRYGELYTVYGETIKNVKSKTNLKKDGLVLSKSNDVIIPASGETQLDIATASCILKDNIALGGDLNIIRTELNGVFLSYYLNNTIRHNIASLSQGVSVVHLYATQLKSLNLNIPLKEEQQKIADFLTKIDNKIEHLSKKKKLLESYKKGVMQKIFSQELMFKDDEGNSYPDWENKKLGAIGKTYNGLTGKTKEDFGEGKAYIQYKQIFDNSKININNFGYVDIKKNDKQNLANYGDVFFTTSSETPLEVGFSSVLLNKVKEVYLNSFCFGYRINSLKTLNPEFSQYLFRNDIFRKNIVKLAQGSTRYNMSKIALMKLNIKIPAIEEQTKIANFLTKIDNKINLVEKQLNDSKEYKKGLLQKMFI
jgi:type I restriction enzyme S subunit